MSNTLATNGHVNGMNRVGDLYPSRRAHSDASAVNGINLYFADSKIDRQRMLHFGTRLLFHCATDGKIARQLRRSDMFIAHKPPKTAAP